MKKRIFSTLLVLALLLSLLPGVPARAAAGEAFAGSRVVSFALDRSDVENFYEGGISSLNLRLRKHAPQWLEYELDSAEREWILTLRVQFQSFAEYQSQMDTLVGTVACIAYKYEDGPVLGEDFLPAELLNFLCDSRMEAEKLKAWARVTENSMTLNGQEYQSGEEKFRINYDPTQQFHFSQVKVQTWHTDDGSLARKLELRVGSDARKDPQWLKIQQTCQELGQNFEMGYMNINLEVELRAKTHQELAQLTARCMDSVVRYRQWAAREGDMLNVQWVEAFLLESQYEYSSILSYEYTLPEYMENAVVLSPDTKLDEGKLKGQYGQSWFHASYQKPYTPGENIPDIDIPDVEISGDGLICVKTDASNPFSRIQRTITVAVPVRQAPGYHEELRAYLSNRMVKGTTLEIYDEKDTRYYVLSFSSWFWKDIEEFSAPYIQSRIECSDSWLPMGKSTFRESLGQILPGISGPQEVWMEYVDFPGEAERTMGDDAMCITYQRIHPFKTALEVLVLAVLVWIVVLICRRGKGKKTQPAPVIEEISQRCCTNCGTPLEGEDVFCTNCGTRME